MEEALRNLINSVKASMLQNDALLIVGFDPSGSSFGLVPNPLWHTPDGQRKGIGLLHGDSDGKILNGYDHVRAIPDLPTLAKNEFGVCKPCEVTRDSDLTAFGLPPLKK